MSNSNIRQYEITKQKLMEVLTAIEVMNRATPNEKLTEVQIKSTLKKAQKLSEIYKERLFKLEKENKAIKKRN